MQDGLSTIVDCVNRKWVNYRCCGGKIKKKPHCGVVNQQIELFICEQCSGREEWASKNLGENEMIKDRRVDGKLIRTLSNGNLYYPRPDPDLAEKMQSMGYERVPNTSGMQWLPIKQQKKEAVPSPVQPAITAPITKVPSMSEVDKSLP